MESAGLVVVGHRVWARSAYYKKLVASIIATVVNGGILSGCSSEFSMRSLATATAIMKMAPI